MVEWGTGARPEVKLESTAEQTFLAYLQKHPKVHAICQR
jgi:hypothetical protein